MSITRSVKVFSQQLKKLLILNVPTTVTTWGELQNILSNQYGMSMDNIKAVQKGTNVTFDIPTAQLPTAVEGEELFLFLFPGQKIKSGSKNTGTAIQRTALYATIKDMIAADPSRKEYFKGYTNMPTAKIAELVEAIGVRDITDTNIATALEESYKLPEPKETTFASALKMIKQFFLGVDSMNESLNKLEEENAKLTAKIALLHEENLRLREELRLTIDRLKNFDDESEDENHEELVDDETERLMKEAASLEMQM